MQEKKFAVVVGGSSGIGKEVANLLIENNIDVAVISSSPEKLEKISNTSNDQISTFVCDVRSEENIINTFEKIKQEHSKIDFLINCVGSSKSKSVLENTSEGFDDDINVNLRAPYLCILHSYKIMPPGSAIVNVSSIRAQTGTPSGIGYAAAKAGVINLTKSAALQLSKLKIRVNCVVPSAVYPTGMSSHWTADKIAAITSGVPFERLASPAEIGKVIYFFISDSSSMITGQVIDINGGELIT